MNFRDLAAGTDQAVLAAVGEDALLDGQPVRIMFCEPFIEPSIGTLRTNLTQPMAYLPEAAAARVGAVLIHSGKTYDVVAREPDGTGWVGLVLRVQ